MAEIIVRNRKDVSSLLDRLKTSWQLAKESFRILMLDKELLLFPLLSGILLVFVIITYIFPLFIGKSASVMFQPHAPIYYTWTILIFYFLSYFVIIFFNVALISCVSIRLKGRDPTFTDGIRNAFRNIHKIALWALISATVGIIINYIERRFEKFGRIIASLFGIAWSLATFFVVPVMIFEHGNLLESLKKSAQLFKKTWGESVAGEFGIGAFFGLLSAICIAGFISTIWIIVFGHVSPILILPLTLFFAIALFILIPMISSALNGIYITALYTYATTKKVPKGFSAEFIKNAYAKKV